MLDLAHMLKTHTTRIVNYFHSHNYRSSTRDIRSHLVPHYRVLPPGRF